MSQRKFRDLCFLKSFCRFFEKFVVFCGFSLYRLAFLSKGSDFHEKNPPDLLVFWLWFSPPSEKIFRNVCIPKTIWRFLEKSASVLCAKATIEHAASGWCAAVIFWKKSTRFAGFLVVIFTSQSKNLQQILHSEKNLGNFGRCCNFFVFSFGRLEFLSKGNGFLENIHQICWFSGCDFHLQAKNLQKFMHSEKNLEIFWKFCTFFVLKSYYRTRRLGVVRGSDFLEKIHKICWFSGCDFHLPVKKSSAIYAFWTNSGDFSAVAVAMMSNDEQWWVMNADDADDGCWWWCWWSRKLYKQIAQLPINRPTGAEY